MRVFIFGAQGTGKTELLKQLINQKATNLSSPDYKTTIGPDFQMLDGMQIWDSPGTNGPNKNFNVPFMAGAKVGIYCINLSKVLDERVLEQMKTDVSLFQIRSGNAKLILVGTFSDQALEENTVESLRNKLDEFGFTDVLTATTNKSHGTHSVLRMLQHNKKLDKIEALRNGLSANAGLYSALDKLINQVDRLGLQGEEIDFLSDEVKTLLIKITNPQALDKTKAYDEFLANCDAKFTDKYHSLKAAIKAFSAAVFVTALAASLFFGAGIFLGAWAGTATFFAALVESTSAATAFSAGTSATAIISLAYYGNSFFQKPVNNVAGEFIESVKNVDIDELNLNGI
ncbi:hypothetical protein ACD661_02555 [Legionella lytica]|uniref:Rho GTPase (Miro-like) n=1 Tax=Legionella lytica TaxID=96232 RepID=A0ABW8D767_9GAMM